MKKLSELSKDEKSLLLFLECRAVDQGGLVDIVHMNTEDMALAKRWNDEGFILFGRVSMESIQKSVSKATHWCELSEEAFTLAHEERKARSVRMWEKRTWLKGVESHRNIAGVLIES